MNNDDIPIMVDPLAVLGIREIRRECRHERLNEEGYCRRCGADCRGITGDSLYV